MLHFINKFDESDLFDQVLIQRPGQDGQTSIKMAMA
jgi:hypothetical protein